MGVTAGVPPRVEAGTKAGLLDLVDGAVEAGWTTARACAVLELDGRRCRRWQHRRSAGRLDDDTAGGTAVHAITPAERQAVLELFERWGDIDGGYRKLAHRGSYENLVWVSPSTLYRVLAGEGLVLPPRAAHTRAGAAPGGLDRVEAPPDLDLRHHAFPPSRPRRLRHLGRRHPQMARHPPHRRGDRHPGRGRLHRRARRRRPVGAHRGPPSPTGPPRRRQRPRADPAGNVRQRPPDASRHHPGVPRHVLHRRPLRPARNERRTDDENPLDTDRTSCTRSNWMRRRSDHHTAARSDTTNDDPGAPARRPAGAACR